MFYALLGCCLLSVAAGNVDVKGLGNIQNVIVYDEEGKFCGWPANEGIWSWNNEILVGYEVSGYIQHEKEHSIDRNSPKFIYFSRSTDGGVTWTVERPKEILPPAYMELPEGSPEFTAAIKPLSEPINFTDPNFAMKIRSTIFYYSYDRGKSWRGPFSLPNFDQKLIMARTDYLVFGQKECMAFVSSSQTDGNYGKSFVMKTTDGGLNWQLISWITSDFPPLEYKKFSRSTMPSTVRISENSLVTVLRQRLDDDQWLDVYGSSDCGKTWAFLSKAADNVNNPPSLLKLVDGRLCLVYCSRERPYGLRAKLSSDNGKSWSNENVLRDDALSWDIGYVRSIQRSDGCVVSVYYYHTKEKPRQHIAATIWRP